MTEISNGRSDRELMEQHAELTPSDLSALRSYAQLPQPFRPTFRACAEDGGERDEHLELLRRRRKLGPREIAP